MKAGDVLDLKHEGEKFSILRSAVHEGEPFEFIWTVNPKCGPPTHVHPHESETYEVLEGTIDFILGKRHQRLGPGSSATIPKGAKHRVWNSGKVPCSLKVRFSGQGVERVFSELEPGDIAGFVRMAQHCVAERWDSIRVANPAIRAFLTTLAAAGRLFGIRPRHLEASPAVAAPSA